MAVFYLNFIIFGYYSQEIFVKMKCEKFGDLVRKERIKKGITLRHVSAQIEIDQSTLSKIERNEVIAPQRIIKKLSDVLGVDYRKFQIRYLGEKIYTELKNEDFAIESIEKAKNRIENNGLHTKRDRGKLIEKIKNYFDNQPIEKAWVFGSFARDQESDDSDVDLIVRFTQPNEIDLFDYVGFSLELEELIGRPVDLVEDGYLLPEVKVNVVRDKKLIYERTA